MKRVHPWSEPSKPRLSQSQRGNDGRGIASLCAGDQGKIVSHEETPLHLEDAIEEFEGDRQLFFEIVNRFMQTVQAQLEIMDNAQREQDGSKLRLEAHSIKGGSANLTAYALSRAAADLEESAQSGLWEEAKRHLNRLQEEFLRLKTYVQKVQC